MQLLKLNLRRRPRRCKIEIETHLESIAQSFIGANRLGFTRKAGLVCLFDLFCLFSMILVINFQRFFFIISAHVQSSATTDNILVDKYISRLQTNLVYLFVTHTFTC